MSKNRFSAEQIATLLRQIEVSMAQGKTTPVCTENFVRVDEGTESPKVAQ
jgi:hypothetical protein